MALLMALLGHRLVAKTQPLAASPTSRWVLWQNRDSLDRTMAHRTTLEAEQPSQPTKPVSKPAAAEQDRERIFDAFRRWGYYEATLDPIGLFKPLRHPDLAFTGPVAEEARSFYCGTIGAEFMHLAEPERRQWIGERMEAAAPKPNQAKILERLIRADLFEQVLQARYLGAKRFSLE